MIILSFCSPRAVSVNPKEVSIILGERRRGSVWCSPWVWAEGNWYQEKPGAGTNPTLAGLATLQKSYSPAPPLRG